MDRFMSECKSRARADQAEALRRKGYGLEDPVHHKGTKTQSPNVQASLLRASVVKLRGRGFLFEILEGKPLMGSANRQIFMSPFRLIGSRISIGVC